MGSDSQKADRKCRACNGKGFMPDLQDVATGNMPVMPPAEPAQREEPDPLRKLAEEYRSGRQKCPHRETVTGLAVDCQPCLVALLERIVRECAEVAWQSDASGLREDGRYILRRWGLSESEGCTCGFGPGAHSCS